MIALEAGSWVAERQEWERQFSLRVLSHFLNVESHDYVAYTQVNHNEQEAAVLAGVRSPWPSWPGVQSPRSPAAAVPSLCSPTVTLAGPFQQLF